MDFTQPSAIEDLQARISDLMDTIKPEYLSFYGGDASSLPYMAFQSGPQINHYTENFGKFAANSTDTVFLQSAFSSQDVNPILMLPCDNSSWVSLRTVLERVLNVGIIGYPNIVPGPIGGCDGNSVSEELYIRWLQLASFFPLVHFSCVPSQISSLAHDVTMKMLSIREETIVPVILKQVSDTRHNSPHVRPIWWVEPESLLAFEAVDQFMVGDDILVAPVLSQEVTSRDIYIPQGRWTDGWDRTVIHTGPKILEGYEVPVDRIAFFILKS
jgi:hypothetical protein